MEMYHPFLKTFLTVADCGSFLKASEELFLSPPAIMKQMNALEKYLGLTLLERTNQGIRLTKGGESVYQDAKDIIRISDEAVIRALRKEGRHTIRIGTSLLYPGAILMELWNRLSEPHPDDEPLSAKALRGSHPCEFRLKLVPFEDSETTSAASMAGKKCDLVIGAFDATRDCGDSAFMQLGSFSFAIAMSYSHPLAKRKLLAPSDLAGQKLLMMKEGNSPRNDEVRRLLAETVPTLAIADVPFHYGAEEFNRAEEEGCLLLTLTGWKNVHPSLVTIPFDVDIRLPYGIIYPRHPGISVALFLEVLKGAIGGV